MVKSTLMAALLCCAINVSAQDVPSDRNRTYRITLNNIQYTHHNEKMSAGEAVGKVQNGGKDIKAALDAGEQLLVISID